MFSAKLLEHSKGSKYPEELYLITKQTGPTLSNVPSKMKEFLKC